MIKLETYILLQEFQTNTYLLWDDDSKEAILIDPSMPDTKLLDRIRQLQLKVKMVVNTHGHGDHIGGNKYFADALSCPLAIHTDDAAMLTDNKKNFSEFMGSPVPILAAQVLLGDDDEILLGKLILKVIHTPGHTKGGICLWVDKYLISGDTLFEQSIGRTDFPGGNHKAIIKSIVEKLLVLPDDVIVFPGHGPSTTIGLEKANNPFLR
ncbi:MAG: MBL fold metallo-hydrolase [Candidatus Cloacimonas sp.]|jgi:glyoxylase-like metal-dependent hydrolase (beta-lactamase superfamily II)|nr:MBL fold metallo-hydrolase [Candidatus Cloacimonas sp.]